MSEALSDKGFTLLEVVIAVAILATSLGVLYPTFAVSPRRIQVSNERAIAQAFLQSEFDDVLVRSAWSDLPQQGEYRDWSWVISGESYPHISDTDTSSDFLYKLTAQITHRDSFFGQEIVFERVVVREN